MSQTNWLTLLFVFVTIVLIGFGFKNNFENKANAFIAKNVEIITEQEKRINQLQNGLRTAGDSYQGLVSVADCNLDNRIRFDELLSNLNQLNPTDLNELDQLFNSCAYYYSTIQLVAVDQLSREVDMYFSLLDSVVVIEPEFQEKLNKKNNWDEILDSEKERALLHTRLVDIQKSIVSELIAGKKSAHTDVQALVAQGQEVRDNILFLTQQIDQQRKELVNS